MKKYVIIIASALLLLSCNENRNRRVERVMDDVGCRMSEDSSDATGTDATGTGE